MKALLLIVSLALGLVIFIGADQPVAASSEFLSSPEATDTQMIRTLKRSSKEIIENQAAFRDPFATPAPAAAPVEPASATLVRLPANPAPSVPSFQIIGKQEDDDGWAVFISAPDKPGQVWVVREGEAFNEHFRVSKLAPPWLIINSTRSRQSRTFNIGKDEE